jgi:vacuolar-type H+-ATPase subunit H
MVIHKQAAWCYVAPPQAGPDGCRVGRTGGERIGGKNDVPTTLFYRRERRSFVALKALEDVQIAERRAEEMIRKARQEGQEALRAAEGERQEVLLKTREEARAMIDEEVSGASEKAREKIAALREQHTGELDTLRKAAGKNLDQAVEMVLEVLRKT